MIKLEHKIAFTRPPLSVAVTNLPASLPAVGMEVGLPTDLSAEGMKVEIYGR